jgi:hypothetical protein
MYVTDPGNVVSVLVSRRTQVDITSLVNRAISNVSLVDHVFQVNVAIKNNSAQTYVPVVEMNVIGINSTSGTIRAINADNSKDGTSAANAALYGYSDKIGSEEQFSPNEATEARTLRFQDNAEEMFTFDAIVTAYIGPGGGSSSGSSSQGGAPAPPAGGGGVTGGLLSLNKVTAVMRFTANPLTRTVTAQLIKLK